MVSCGGVGGGRGSRRIRTAAIFAWRLGGIRLAAGVFIFAIFDDGGRAGVTGALIGEFEAAAGAAAVVSIEWGGRGEDEWKGEDEGAERRSRTAREARETREEREEREERRSK